jgi:general secretion pathway protein B
MSFILDALKKSENERQRHRGPSLAEVPQRRPANERPWWVFGLAALLVLNLAVFVFVLLRQHAPPAQATAAATAPSASAAPSPPIASTPAATSPPPIARRDVTVRSLAEEAGVAEEPDTEPPLEPDLSAAANVPERPPIVSPIQGPTVEPVRTPPVYEENLPTVNDIIASGTQLPPLHLDIHVYANNPSDRFVFLNMKKYREGDTTSEGLLVEAIRRDDVVLSHQGKRFALPRT